MLRRPPPSARATGGGTRPSAHQPIWRLVWYGIVSGTAIVGSALLVSELLAGVHPVLMFGALFMTLGGTLYVASRLIASRLAPLKHGQDDRQHTEHGDHRHQAEGVGHTVRIAKPDLLHGTRSERD